ncbi:MAG: type I-G CRISPR-associated helicase/endonuclease Cas3g [Acidimicrobiales bacterium]
MSAPLSVAEFPEFFQAVYGVDPFPWQQRLVAEVHAEQRWPDLFDLPTGAGKTAVIDASIFLLALDATRPIAHRWVARRTVMVVDRRVVVDQAAQRAETLARELALASRGVLKVVADRLRSLAPSDPDPLAAVTLRGGVARDDAWIRRPDQPLVIASTVDQVGSRLLFQGYGVSRGMRPIHAGLLANDVLFVLDEVHLSEPFAETLRAIRDRFQHTGEDELANRWGVTELSATPGVEDAPGRWVFTLGEDDRGPSESAQLLQRRIRAPKPARLESVKVSAKDAEKARLDLATSAAQHALELASRPHVGTVAVVVNRVDTAEKVHALLRDSDAELEVALLTGRMRAVERDPLVGIVSGRLGSGATRDSAQCPLVVVATQCIEAGADFDFDALVTECASIDALRQRFGRLDRVGRLAESGCVAEAVILGPSASVAGGSSDAVYGESLAATWQWLGISAIDGVVDFGISALRVPAEPELQPRRPHAPHLLPAHLDFWVETPLAPSSTGPAVASWLHGSDEVDTDVQVVWRADLSEELLRSAAGDPSDDPMGSGERLRLQMVRDILSFCRPLSSEAVAVPLRSVRRWLAQTAAPPADVSDVEGARTVEDDSRTSGFRPFVQWPGDDSLVGTAASDLRPGSTVVVPSSYGGLDTAEFAGQPYAWWSPESAAPVRDLGDLAHELRGGQLVRRLFPEGTPGAAHGYAGVPVPAGRPPELDSWTHLQESWVLDDSTPLAGFPRSRSRLAEFIVAEESSWYALSSLQRSPSRTANDEAAGDEVDSDPETSPFTGAREAELVAHLSGVRAKAAALAEGLGLPSDLVSDLALAGELHDVGKADQRFQTWLRGGIPRAGDQPYLAKSTTPAFDRRAREQARRASSYPRGGRHEALSLTMIEGRPEIECRARDWLLVQHLVVSHHGWGRPFVPAVIDRNPEAVHFDLGGTALTAPSNHALARIDSGVAERYWELVARYGWFRLAWFEAILRLADHRQSAEEQQQ